MPSLDSIKKSSLKKTDSAASKNKKKKVLSIKTNPDSSKKTSFFSQEENAKRLRLWVFVSMAMVLVIGGWLFFLSRRIKTDLTRGGGFQSISQDFSRMFQDIDSKITQFRQTFSFKALTETKEEQKAKQIKELEKKVFPQFENK